MAFEEIPDDTIEQVRMLEGIMIASATGGSDDNPIYELLRKRFMSEPITKKLLPSFVRTYRSLDAFWPYIKDQFGTYAERRQFISVAFTPLVEHLDEASLIPIDEPVAEVLRKFDADGVLAIWMRALERRTNDPEGAITLARTLLETTCKRVLDELDVTYDDKADLPKLYSATAKSLNLAPNQHSLEPLKAILGSVTNLVNGLGTLRNRLSDSHGRGGRLPVKPSQRHASLAVNTAGAVASFLIESMNEQIKADAE
jgi:hypothetical protein